MEKILGANKIGMKYYNSINYNFVLNSLISHL